MLEVFERDSTGKVVAALKPDGTQATEADMHDDARAWADNFGMDAFNNHCVNHEHDCTETCIKYAKKRLKAKQNLRSHKVRLFSITVFIRTYFVKVNAISL